MRWLFWILWGASALAESLLHPLEPFAQSLADYEVSAQFAQSVQNHPAFSETQTALNLTARKRITERVDFSLRVPLAQVSRTDIPSRSSAFLGDIEVGAQWILLRDLFYSDWFPTITLFTGSFLPTGTVEQVLPTGEVFSGTGAGTFRPVIALKFSKQQQRWGYVLEARWHALPARMLQQQIAWKRFELGPQLKFSLLGRYSPSKLSLAAGLEQSFFSGPSADRRSLESQSDLAIIVRPGLVVSELWQLEAEWKSTLSAGPLTSAGLRANSISFQARHAFY